MNEDPLIAHEIQPNQTAAEMVRADERLKNEFARMTLPLRILHGTADKVTQFSGSQLFCERAGSPDKTIKLYEGHFHDLLNDIDKELVIADIKSWIAARLTATESVARFAEDLKKFDVPTLLLHREDDQLVPVKDSSRESARLI